MPQKDSVISYQVILGDSLTDGGQLQQSKPLLAGASGLSNSPYGRFTDGYTWADDIARRAALDILKEQFIEYIINAVQPEKLDDPEIEIAEFKDYIRAIDLEKFHPDTFNFEKLKDSYLKRHYVEQKIIAYFSDLFRSSDIDKEQAKAFLDYLKSIPLENFHPDTFDLNKLLDSYKKIDSSKQQFVSSIEGMINKSTIAEMVIKSRNTYKTAQSHHNNIFAAIDYNRFSIKDLNENFKNFLYGSFSLGNYQRILFQGHNFVRRFAEGGLSAHNYWPLPDLQTLSLILKKVRYNLSESSLGLQYLASFVGQFFMLLGKVLAARAMLSSLEEKTDSLLKDDIVQDITLEQKAKTLITEWTGANDFITMQAFASEKVCDDAVKARMDNIIKLAKAGYSNFLLLDFPDLGKTPRFINSPEKERAEVTRLVQYFNKKLRDEIETIRKANPELNIKLFPLNERFDAIYNDPAAFGLSKNIDKTHPLLSFNPKDLKEDGYMFWDDVHPSNQMHHALAQEVYKFCQQNYNLQPPVEIGPPCCPVNIAKGLLVMFKDKYTRAYEDYAGQLIGGVSRFFGLGSNKQSFANINFDPENMEQARKSLAQLYQLSKHDKIVKQSMVDMGWLQKDGKIPKHQVAPILKQAYKIANPSVVKEVSNPEVEVVPQRAFGLTV